MSGVLAVPMNAASAEEKAEKRRQLLEKYDTNKDGKINRDERAVKKADDQAERERKKAEREAKKKKKAEAAAANDPA